MKNLNKLLFISSLGMGILFFLNSCKKIDDPVANESNSTGDDYTNGALIVNEGSFGAGNGSISFYNYASHNTQNNVFQVQNNRPLGDVVQSAYRNNGNTYICVNASNKVEVVNSTSFKELATISVNQPRYMVSNGVTGYVSSWGNGGEINVVDLTTNSVSSTIAVGSGPEGMTIANGNLYVANSGGFSTDSTVSVIAGGSVIATIDIGAYNPSTIVNGNNNNIWVLAKGKVIYDGNWNILGHEPSKVVEINTTSNTVISSTVLLAEGHPSMIQVSNDGSTLYLGGSFSFPGIYTISTSSTSTPTGLYITESNYGFFVNSLTEEIYILKDASSANGKLSIYNAGGNKLSEHSVGIFPNGGVN
jgi:YVTN family beta-propeller protein